jgi:hypothetical protein
MRTGDKHAALSHSHIFMQVLSSQWLCQNRNSQAHRESGKILMKKESTSQSAFFNLAVLIGLFVFLPVIFLALFATANRSRLGFGPAAGPSQVRGSAASLSFFQGKADFGERYPSVRTFCNQPTKVAETGDILISVRTPVGPTNVVPSRCCIGPGLAAIRGKKIDPTFLLHFFRLIGTRLMRQGSTLEAIHRHDLFAKAFGVAAAKAGDR